MEDRSQYLGLAQLSQNLVRSILLYLERDQWDALKRTVSEIVGPLEAFLSDADEPVSPAAAFASYEQLSTLTEAWDEAEIKDVLERLKKLLATEAGPEAKQGAQGLIDPFQRLSTQALWKFEQPEVGLPAGIFELCRAH
jgi:hypothetical protein